MRAALRALGSVALSLLITGCHTWTVHETVLEPTYDLLTSERVELQAKDLEIGDGTVAFRVIDWFDNRYRKTTTTLREVRVHKEGLTEEIWSNDELGLLNSVIWPATVAIDLLMLTISGPYAYIGAWADSADPEPVVEEVNMREPKELAYGTRLKLSVSGQEQSNQPTIKDDSRIVFTWSRGTAAQALREGYNGVDYKLWREEDPGLKASMRVSLEQLVAIAEREMSSVPRSRRDAWRQIYDAVPTDAKKVRTALWAKLEPLEDSIPYSSRVVALEARDVRVDGHSISAKLRRAYDNRHRAGNPVRLVRETVPAGTKLWLYVQGHRRSVEPSVDSQGRVSFGLKSDFPEHLLRQGHAGIDYEVAIQGQDEVRAKFGFTLQQLIAAADSVNQGTTTQRYQVWQAILDECPQSATEVRSAIERFIAPLTTEVTRLAKNDEQVQSIGSNIEENYGEDPKSAEDKAKVARMQIDRANLLLSGRYAKGDPRRGADRKLAAEALGEAARHASDLDDLDALEALIERQIAVRNGGR